MDRELFASVGTEHGRAMYRAAHAYTGSDAADEAAVGEAVLRACGHPTLLFRKHKKDAKKFEMFPTPETCIL